MTDLAKLSKPFPDSLVRKAPKGKYGDYVPHHTVTQALLATVGAYDFHIKEIVRGTGGQVEAVICQLVVEIDGHTHKVEEVGDCEKPDNWPTEGGRLKDAVSDALKRCAMRLGLGLSLWCQDDYFLHESLTRRDGNGTQGDPAASPVLAVKRAHFRTICKKANVDPDECAQELDRPAISLEQCDEEQLDQLISMKGSG